MAEMTTIANMCRHFPPAIRNIDKTATKITRYVPMSGCFKITVPTTARIPTSGRSPHLTVVMRSFMPAKNAAA